MCVFKECKCVHASIRNSHGWSDPLHHVEKVHGFGLISSSHHQDPVLEWDLTFDGQRYQVSLPWKENTPPLPDNLRKLKQKPQLLAEYDSIIRDQLSRGIVEVVNDPSLSEHDRVHYLPHHGVIQQDN